MSGHTLAELSAGRDPWDVLCDLVLADSGAAVVVEMMDEADVRTIMSSPLVGIGSDNGPPIGMHHPRTWGCFPRLLGRYVREEGLLTWEEAIRKGTTLTAEHFGLDGRGVLDEGMVADICAFDPERVGHSGTYHAPSVAPTGIEMVLVGGRAAVWHGAFTGERAGAVLRRG